MAGALLLGFVTGGLIEALPSARFGRYVILGKLY